MENLFANLNLDALYLVVFLVIIMSAYSIGFSRMINSWFMIIINILISYSLSTILASYFTFIPMIPDTDVDSINSFLESNFYKLIAFAVVYIAFYFLIKVIRQFLETKSKLSLLANHLLAILVGLVLFVGTVYSSATMIEASKNDQLIKLKKQSQVIVYLEKYNYFKPNIF